MGSAKKKRPLPRLPRTDVEGQSLVKELNEQTDRGVALIAGAIVELTLQHLIEMRFGRGEVRQEGKKTSMPEAVFSTTGCLSSFRSKIDIAFCLQIIGPVTYADLWNMIKVRNLFAHRIEQLRFENDSEIKTRCDGLTLRFYAVGLTPPKKPDDAPAREKYIGNAMAVNLLARNYVAAQSAGKETDKIFL